MGMWGCSAKEGPCPCQGTPPVDPALEWRQLCTHAEGSPPLTQRGHPMPQAGGGPGWGTPWSRVHGPVQVLQPVLALLPPHLKHTRAGSGQGELHPPHLAHGHCPAWPSGGPCTPPCSPPTLGSPLGPTARQGARYWGLEACHCDYHHASGLTPHTIIILCCHLQPLPRALGAL